MSWIGDIALGDTIDTKFCTVQTTGAPFTLAGSPVISAYPGNSVTQLTGGITLSVDFDSVTGLNNVRVVATTGNSYLTATDYQLVLTTGTVNSVSAVGYVVSEFSIEKRRGMFTLPVGGTPALGVIDAGTLQSATATTAVLRSAANFTADGTLVGATLHITGGTGVGQRRLITAYTNSSDTATVDTWTTTPDNTSTYNVYASAPGSTTSPVPADLRQILGATVATPATSGVLDINVKNINNVVAATPGAAGGVFIAGTNAATTVTTSFTTTFTGSLTGSVASVTAAVTCGALSANTITAASIASGALTAAKFAAGADPTAPPAATATPIAKIDWLCALALQKVTQTATTMLVKAADGTTTIGTSTVSDNGTTATRGAFS